MIVPGARYLGMGTNRRLSHMGKGKRMSDLKVNRRFTRTEDSESVRRDADRLADVRSNPRTGDSSEKKEPATSENLEQ